jgi:TOBE domain
VASFVGTLNILVGRVVDPAIGKDAVDGQELVTSSELTPDEAGKERLHALRPEAIALEPPGSGRNTLTVTVEEVNFLGGVVRIRTRVKDAEIALDVFNDPSRVLPERGRSVALGFSRDNLMVSQGRLSEAVQLSFFRSAIIRGRHYWQGAPERCSWRSVSENLPMINSFIRRPARPNPNSGVLARGTIREALQHPFRAPAGQPPK